MWHIVDFKYIQLYLSESYKKYNVKKEMWDEKVEWI